MNKKQVGKMIRKARLLKKLTQIELARGLGYTTPQFVSNIERGTVSVPLNKVNKICFILGLDVKTMLRSVSASKIEPYMTKEDQYIYNKIEARDEFVKDFELVYNQMGADEKEFTKTAVSRLIGIEA